MYGWPVTGESESAQERERTREKDREIAQLWQQVLREELRHRRDFRGLFDHHEKILGQKVRQLRTERGWSQEQLAEKLNSLGWAVHQTTIAKLEGGARPIRIAEADTLAVAFGLPIEAMWYMPVTGEPWSLTQMRDSLKRTDEFIAHLEDSLRSTILTLADQQAERMRLVQAMNEAAKAADKGELEDLGLSTERSLEFVQAMAADHEEVIESMDPETRATLRREHLELLKKGEPERLAAEAWRLHQAGESPATIARFLAGSMPPGTVDPLAAATEILRESLGIDVPATTSGEGGT
jgi:transcriptional regulator with XRE-family HTH domain